MLEKRTQPNRCWEVTQAARIFSSACEPYALNCLSVPNHKACSWLCQPGTHELNVSPLEENWSSFFAYNKFIEAHVSWSVSLKVQS